jgi:aminoglycoside phosphotransferase
VVFRISSSKVLSLEINDMTVLGHIEVGGAQDPRIFEQIFAQLEKNRNTDVLLDGDACLPDGSNC